MTVWPTDLKQRPFKSGRPFNFIKLQELKLATNHIWAVRILTIAQMLRSPVLLPIRTVIANPLDATPPG